LRQKKGGESFGAQKKKGSQEWSFLPSVFIILKLITIKNREKKLCLSEDTTDNQKFFFQK